MILFCAGILIGMIMADVITNSSRTIKSIYNTIVYWLLTFKF
jgi:hypothetical protein